MWIVYRLDLKLKDDIVFVSRQQSDKKIKKIEEKIIDYTYDLDLKYDVLLSPIIESITNYNKMVSYISFYKNVEKEGIFL